MFSSQALAMYAPAMMGTTKQFAACDFALQRGCCGVRMEGIRVRRAAVNAYSVTGSQALDSVFRLCHY